MDHGHETKDGNKTLYEGILGRQHQLENIRRPHDDLRDEVIEYLRPELSSWKDESQSAKGKKREYIYSGAPEEALENWSDGMQGHLVSPSIDWFDYLLSDTRLNDIPEVRQWRQQSREVIYSLLRDSNFYSSLGPVFRDAGSVGDALLFIQRNDDEGKVDFETFHPRELYYSKNILHRKFEMSAKDAADAFDESKLSRRLKESLKSNDLEARYEFIHAVYKSTDKILDGETGLPDRDWISIYIEAEADKETKPLVKTGGYHTRPYARWSYSMSSDSVYGWGIGCSAIIDVATINAVAKTNLQQAQMQTDPPVLASSTLRGRLNLRPHGMTYVSSPEEIVEPIFDRINTVPGLDREERLSLMIDRRFNVDFFLMLARAEKPMTATEILEKTGERSILMGPKIGRMEVELLDPIHERVFAIALEEGLLPQPPDILLEESDGKINVSYIGPLAQAQKRLIEGRRIGRTVESIAPLLEINPASAMYMNTDLSIQRILRSEDWPEEEIRTDEEVAAMREEQQRQQEAAQAAELAQGVAEAVPKLQGKTEEGSPLEAIIGQ